MIKRFEVIEMLFFPLHYNNWVVNRRLVDDVFTIPQIKDTLSIKLIIYIYFWMEFQFPIHTIQ